MQEKRTLYFFPLQVLNTMSKLTRHLNGTKIVGYVSCLNNFSPLSATLGFTENYDHQEGSRISRGGPCCNGILF